VTRKSPHHPFATVDRSEEFAVAEPPSGTRLPEIPHCSRATAAFLASTPVVIARLEDLLVVPNDPRAAFILSRIDGEMTIQDVLDASGIAFDEALALLEDLLILDVVALR